VALLALGKLGLDERRRRTAPALDIAPEASPHLLIQSLVSGDPACLQQRGADHMICLGEADAVVDRTNRVSDLEAEIPKEVEHLFNDLLAARQDLVGNQEQQIEIRIGRQLAAAVSPDGNQRKGLTGRRVGRRIEMAHDVVIERADHLIDKQPVGPGRLHTALTAFETAADRRAAFLVHPFQQGDYPLARLTARQIGFGNRRHRRAKRRPIDQRRCIPAGLQGFSDHASSRPSIAFR
jgi:hypothetical protein